MWSECDAGGLCGMGECRRMDAVMGAGLGAGGWIHVGWDGCRRGGWVRVDGCRIWVQGDGCRIWVQDLGVMGAGCRMMG